MKKIQHGRAVLPTVEGHTHLIEPVPLVGLLHDRESVAEFGTERRRQESGSSWWKSVQEPVYIIPIRTVTS